MLVGRFMPMHPRRPRRRSWWRRLWRRLVGIGAVVMAVMSVSAGARADFVDGNHLYEACGSTVSYARGNCAGYVEGVADALHHNSINGFTACLPTGGTTVGQIQEVVR